MNFSKLSNSDLHRLRDRILALYKEKNFDGFDPELQMMLCVILTFVSNYEASTGQQLQFGLDQRQVPVPVDDL